MGNYFQVRAQCIVECIHVAPVPWIEGTEEMYKLGLTLNTSLSSQLEDQRRFVGLKLVLRRYSLHLTNISDPRNAEVCCVFSLAVFSVTFAVLWGIMN